MNRIRQSCPFCGGAGQSLTETWRPFDAGHVGQVICMRCSTRGPSRYSEVSADDAIEQAVAAWNQRAGVAA